MFLYKVGRFQYSGVNSNKSGTSSVLTDNFSGTSSVMWEASKGGTSSVGVGSFKKWDEFSRSGPSSESGPSSVRLVQDGPPPAGLRPAFAAAHSLDNGFGFHVYIYIYACVYMCVYI